MDRIPDWRPAAPRPRSLTAVSGRAGGVIAGVVLAAAAWTATADARVRTGPDGPRFYRPPAALVRHGAAGTPIWVRAADPLVALPEASRTLAVVYRSVSVRGRPVAMSGSLALPKGAPPAGGWRTVVWNHVTTGAADSCAPSLTTPGNSERERMTRADPTVRRMLAAGLAVVRPDYEGIATAGAHPYLIGSSLARSATDAMRAARRIDRRLGIRWAVAGHSEGGIAALFTGQLARSLAPDLDLRAVSAVAPPSRIRDLIDGGSVIPLASPATAGLTALAGLILDGAQVADPALGRLYRAGGLSAKALALLPDVRRRCLNDLSAADSWGGIAPAEIPGPEAARLKAALYPVIDANDPKTVRIPDIPVRIDQGLLDAVVPFPFTEELVSVLRAHGTAVTYARYPGSTHQNITAADQAAGPVTSWLAEHLR